MESYGTKLTNNSQGVSLIYWNNKSRGHQFVS